MSKSALADILTGRSRPQKGNLLALLAAADRWARTQLKTAGVNGPGHKLARLHAYLDNRAKTPTRCPECGAPVNERATYCSNSCKQKAYRRRARLNIDLVRRDSQG